MPVVPVLICGVLGYDAVAVFDLAGISEVVFFLGFALAYGTAHPNFICLFLFLGVFEFKSEGD